MNRKGILIAEIAAVLFVPGAIPAFIAVNASKIRKKFTAQRNIEG